MNLVTYQLETAGETHSVFDGVLNKATMRRDISEMITCYQFDNLIEEDGHRNDDCLIRVDNRSGAFAVVSQ